MENISNSYEMYPESEHIIIHWFDLEMIWNLENVFMFKDIFFPIEAKHF